MQLEASFFTAIELGCVLKVNLSAISHVVSCSDWPSYPTFSAAASICPEKSAWITAASLSKRTICKPSVWCFTNMGSTLEPRLTPTFLPLRSGHALIFAAFFA